MQQLDKFNFDNNTDSSLTDTDAAMKRLVVPKNYKYP